jgi:F-type H+-transporting ATPase subunit epsilon
MALTVSIVTPEAPITSGDYEQVLAPSILGDAGILPMHRPMLADLREGLLVLKNSAGDDCYAVSGGFLEVSNDRVTVLAESAEHARDIDVERATAALQDSDSKVKSLESSDPEYHNQIARGRRARARLEVAKTIAH